MTQLISHPFRLNPNGTVVTLEDSTDEFLAEQIAVLVLTKPGERQLVPSFGVNDPAFDRLDISALQAGLSVFGPDVLLTEVRSEYISDHEADVYVAFE